MSEDVILSERAAVLSRLYGLEFGRTLEVLKKTLVVPQPPDPSDPSRVCMVFKPCLETALSLLDEHPSPRLDGAAILAIFESEEPTSVAERESAASHLFSPRAPLASRSTLADDITGFLDELPGHRPLLLTRGVRYRPFHRNSFLDWHLSRLLPLEHDPHSEELKRPRASPEVRRQLMKLKNLDSVHADKMLRIREPLPWLTAPLVEAIFSAREPLLDLKMDVLARLSSALRPGGTRLGLDEAETLVAGRLGPERTKFLRELDLRYAHDENRIEAIPTGGLDDLEVVTAHVIAEADVGLYDDMTRALLDPLTGEEASLNPRRPDSESYWSLLLKLPRERVDQALWRYRTLKQRHDAAAEQALKRLRQSPK